MQGLWRAFGLTSALVLAGGPALAAPDPGGKVALPPSASKPHEGRTNAAPGPSAPPAPGSPAAGPRTSITSKGDRAAKELDTSRPSHWQIRVDAKADIVVPLSLRAGSDLTILLSADAYHRGQGRMKIQTPSGTMLCDGAQSACDMQVGATGVYRFIVSNLGVATGQFLLIISPAGGPGPVNKSPK